MKPHTTPHGKLAYGLPNVTAWFECDNIQPVFRYYVKGIDYSNKPRYLSTYSVPVHGVVVDDTFKPFLHDGKLCVYDSIGGIKGYNPINKFDPCLEQLLNFDKYPKIDQHILSYDYA